MSVPSLFLKSHESRKTLFHSQRSSVWVDDIVQKNSPAYMALAASSSGQRTSLASMSARVNVELSTVQPTSFTLLTYASTCTHPATLMLLFAVQQNSTANRKMVSAAGIHTAYRLAQTALSYASESYIKLANNLRALSGRTSLHPRAQKY